VLRISSKRYFSYNADEATTFPQTVSSKRVGGRESNRLEGSVAQTDAESNTKLSRKDTIPRANSSEKYLTSAVVFDTISLLKISRTSDRYNGEISIPFRREERQEFYCFPWQER
jgi:hypothetical protein